MSERKGTETSVLVLHPKGTGQFPHPLPLPPMPVPVRVPPGKFDNDFQVKHGLFFIAIQTAVAPIERVHLLIQNQNEFMRSGCLTTPYKGIKDCFRRTINQEGILSLWRGNSVNVYKVCTFQGLAFAIYKNSWHNVGDNKVDEYANLKFHAAVGSATLLQYPLDYARTRLANDIKPARNVQFSLDSARKFVSKDIETRQFSGMFDVWKQTVKSDGIFGLYRGYGLSIFGILAWDWANKMIKAQHNSTLMAGFLSTVAFCSVPVALYPLTRVSRKMMMSSGEGKTRYINSVHAFREIVGHEGFGSLYKGVPAGMVLCFARVQAISVSLSLVVYFTKA